MNRSPFTLQGFVLGYSLTLSLGLAGCGSDPAVSSNEEGEHEHCADGHIDAECPGTPSTTPLAQTLFVAHEGVLSSYDLATGAERPGTVQNVTAPVDLQALADGVLLVNLTGRNEVLTVDGRTMLELARLPSSGLGAVRPVHSYLSPTRNGKSYGVTLNDGAQSQASSNSARFIDVTPGSTTYLKALGEVGLGIGHHKASFSSSRERLVISNIADCNEVLSVYDYGDLGSIQKLAMLNAADAGWTAADPGMGGFNPRFCDPTYQRGLPPSPHGCATSKVSGKAYCNLTGSGELVAVAIDATPPTFQVIATDGADGGYTKAHPAGRYIYSLQGEPREGSTAHPGAVCQLGQLVVLDAMTDSVVKQLPLSREPGCTTSILGTDEETTGPSHSQISSDGKTLFITLAGGFMIDSARSRLQLVVDLSDPANPVQQASMPVGVSSDHHGDALSGDGKYLFVTNNLDNTVSQIEVASRSVVRTIAVQAKPLSVATFGSVEGPSKQTGPIE